MILKSSLINSKIGKLYAVADDEKLYFLEFADRLHLTKMLDNLQKHLNSKITENVQTKPLQIIEEELHLYFANQLKTFKTPLQLIGTTFQQCVWQALLKIPFGETRSYLDIAKAIGQPTACRAVARANSANHLPIIIPCHRVINSNNQLGGYSGGLDKKAFLLKHERYTSHMI